MSESSAGNAQMKLDIGGTHYMEALTEPEGAVKYDSGKARMELLPLASLEEIAKVMTFGAEKYAAHGWKSLEGAEGRYTGALLRHLAALDKGEEVDPETGLPHIAHAACNAMFLTHFYLEKANGQ